MRTRRWIGFAVFAVLFSALCVRLGFWQWHRMEHKKHLQAIIEKHMDMRAVPLEHVLKPGRGVSEDQEWTPVRATGRFDARHEVTVKFTTRDGNAGADVVTPLVLADGRAVIVDRGWMSTANTNARPTNIPPPPNGTVTVEGWLRPDNQAGDNAVVPIDGQVRAIASHGLARFVGRELLPGFINLRSPRESTLSPEPRPHVGHALNFFYAWQWWFFSVLSLIAPFWFARAEARDQGSPGPGSPDA